MAESLDETIAQVERRLIAGTATANSAQVLDALRCFRAGLFAKQPLVPIDFHSNPSDICSRPFTLYADDHADWLQFAAARQGMTE